MSKEIWKKLDGYKYEYEISNLGNARRKQKKSGLYKKIGYINNKVEQQLAKNYLDKLQNTTGSEAKTIGTKLKGLDTDRWDANSSKIMKDLIKQSFEQNPDALAKLLATGNAELTHTQDKGKWGKEFPKLLMEVRNELNNQTNIDFNNDSSESFDEC